MLLEEPRIERVRHELKARIADVIDVNAITPLMRRIVLHSSEFSDLVSYGFDDHVRLILPDKDNGEIVLPQFGKDGPRYPEDAKAPESREYTLRFVDARSRSATIDFVLHGDGPAASWAAAAKPGDRVGVAGPRGSMVVKGDFDWHLLVGDETALPAIARRIEELPAGTTVIARIEIANANERQKIESAAELDLSWVERNGTAPGRPDLLLESLKSTTVPDGRGYAFVAAESAVSKHIRHYLVEQRNVDGDWIKAPAYWRHHRKGYDDGHAH